MLAFIALSAAIATHQPKQTLAKPVQLAAMCFKSGEEVSGVNKICFYNCMGSQAAITISVVALCPLSIDR